MINAYEDDGDDDTVDGTEDDTVAATATTDANGEYTLTLAAGDYVICESCPPTGSSRSRIRATATARESTGTPTRATRLRWIPVMP